MSDGAGSLQHEIHQNKPFHSIRQEAILGLLKTADLIRRVISSVVEPAGITMQQYNVLRILRGAGPDGLACSEIGHRLVTRDPDVTRLLDRLETRALISRGREHADRRVVTARITPAGLALLDTLDAPVRAAVEQMLDHMGARQLTALIDLLELARAPVAESASRTT